MKKLEIRRKVGKFPRGKNEATKIFEGQLQSCEIKRNGKEFVFECDQHIDLYS